jgi:ABC-type nitrate/sulfonate/bicarbonate transport system ATPase subunit
MAHVVIKNLAKEFLNRRQNHRPGDDADVCCFGDSVLVLDDINLEFFEGEMVCILGPSGCGKSTLLRIIAGFEPSFSGQILINGKQTNGPSSDNIFVFQHSALLPWMTVWENVGLGLRRMKDRELKKEKIQEFISMVELDGFEHYYPRRLSGGMQRRAELARALAVNPNLLIMDEPFSGLDFLTHMKMREEVVNMHEYICKTTLVVTHDIDDALIMGDRIVVMSCRPSVVKLERKLDFPHPRNYEKQPELSKLRDEIFLMLGVSYAV